MITFARAYFEISLLLAIAAVALWIAARASRKQSPAHAARWLRIGALWVVAAFAIPVAVRLAPRAVPARPALMMWSKHDAAATAGAALTSLGWTPAPGARARAAIAVSDRQLSIVAGLWCAVVVALGLRLSWIQRGLARFCLGLPVVRRCGRVRLCACDHLGSPISARAAGLSFVVIPTVMWADAAAVRMILAHEAAHLRRGHLRAGWLSQAVTIAFFWHPAVYLWARVTRYLEEVVCDATVAARYGSMAYARCLVWAATIGRTPVYECEGSLPMARGTEDLERRLGMVFNDDDDSTGATRSARRSAAKTAATTLVMAAMVGASFAASAALGDRRVDASQARAMAERVQRETGFAVPVDDWVVAKLNDLVGPRRDWTVRSFARARPLRGAVARQLHAADLPPVLLAVPFTESGFDLAARSSLGSAGLWQFIPSTARRQGLVVDAAGDDRLDPEKSTAAAVAHLSDLHRTLGDWTLAIAAYNCGIENVQAAIRDTGSSDVATMARAGKLCGDARRGYAQTVLASMLLLFDPQQQDWLNAEARAGDGR
jgi:hypothetical protein